MYFSKLVDNIDYPLVLYTTPDILEKIVSTICLKPNILLVDSSRLSTYSETHISRERSIMASDEYKKKIPAVRKNVPEHTIAEYTLINHSKVQYIAHTKKIMPGFDYYSWLDFGFGQNDVSVVPRNINYRKLTAKIIYNNMDTLPKSRLDANTMLTTNEIYLCGGSLIVHTSLVERFEALYTKKLDEWQTQCIADDDQNLVYQLYCENPELFHLVPTQKYCSMFKEWLNCP